MWWTRRHSERKHRDDDGVGKVLRGWGLRVRMFIPPVSWKVLIDDAATNPFLLHVYLCWPPPEGV